MFTFLVAALAIAYIVLKVINTRAKFAEADARREEEEELMRAEAEELEEEEEIRRTAVDVEADTVETHEPAHEEAEA
jgi:flagellar biosynthesis/type III secretory pathway M-ring protein FliF/YscJ